MFFFFTGPLRPSPEPPPPRERYPDRQGEAHRGCGWFDSSHDLQCGLLATEMPPEAPLPAALALEFCLAG